MEATTARSFWKSKKNQHNQKNIHNEMRHLHHTFSPVNGYINTSFEDSNDLTVFSDPIECRVLDGSCRFVCYCCCFLYGYRLDVCILNSKYDCFFFYQEYFKRWKTTLLSPFEELTKMGHSNDLFCGEVTELFKYSLIIYNILKLFFHKEVNL